MSFSVIIPSKTIANLRPCVSCIRAAHEQADIIVVDDFEPGELATHAEAVGPDSLRGCKVVPGVKPFVFSRNVNLGIAAAGDGDVILLNDDACLKTAYGFSYLASVAKAHPQYGIISAGITDAVGNTEQIAQSGTRLREGKHHTLVFVCVYIRRAILTGLKLPGGQNEWLDERFFNYGYDDDDMCERVRLMGGKLGVFDGCVVEHGVLPSTYRGSGSASLTDLRPNRERFIDKWGFAPGCGPSMKAKVETEAGPIKW